MTPKDTKLVVQGFEINLLQDTDFISLTDMLRAKDGEFFIADWLRNRNTVEFLGIWETLHNPNFNYDGFTTIKSQVGLNSYKLSIKEWIEQTNAMGGSMLGKSDMRSYALRQEKEYDMSSQYIMREK